MRPRNLTTLIMCASACAAAASPTYSTAYVVTPSNTLVQALADPMNAKRKCQSIDAASTTPEQVKQTGAMLRGWSFIESPKTFGYATWVVEKSGLHTTYIATYILRDCSLTETRSSQRTFDGPNRGKEANAAYNALITHLLGMK
jgi:hypothetical protein